VKDGQGRRRVEGSEVTIVGTALGSGTRCWLINWRLRPDITLKLAITESKFLGKDGTSVAYSDFGPQAGAHWGCMLGHGGLKSHKFEAADDSLL
jgi:hypothetical protein